MGAFDNVHLPEDIERGAMIGPTFSTTIVTLSGGNEVRNADWDQELLTADISYGVMRKENAADFEDSYARILSFFRARLGRHRSFLFKDWSDFEAIQEPVYRDQTEQNLFPLTKRYGDSYLRRLTRPRPETVDLYYNGEPILQIGASVGGADFPAWRISDLGVITFDSPVSVTEITATFEFDVPMRFETDTLQAAIEWEDAASIPSIKIVQERE